MTVLRREDMQSFIASEDASPCRIAFPPILAIVPTISSAVFAVHQGQQVQRAVTTGSGVALVAGSGTRCSAAQRNPASSRAIATATFRARPCSAANFAKPQHQPLLRFVRNRNDAPWLALAPPHQGHADARAMLIVPRRFDQQPADQRVPSPRDAATSMLFRLGTRRVRAGEYRHQRRGRRKTVRKSCNSARINMAVNVVDATETA